MKNIVIIGNGISGITAARNIRKKSNDKLTVISSETEYFFSRTALMYVFMGHMKFAHTQPFENWFWKKNRINLVFDHVVSVDTAKKELAMKNNSPVNYDVLIIATGSKSNKFGWPGQDLKGVQGLCSKQDLDTMFTYTKDTTHAIIAGGGLIGIEMAEMLRSKDVEVTMLARESSFWNAIMPPEESEMINKLIRKHHINLLLNTELKEITGDSQGRVSSVTLKDETVLHCQFVGLTVGVSPNIEFLKGSGIETDRGIFVNEYLETNIAGIYAIGDCVQHLNPPLNRKPVEQVWYTGRIMGETVAQTICGNETIYQPGNWFNSAKFLDVEYQTYGWVSNKVKDNEESFFWLHPDGFKSIRLNFDKNNRLLLGTNAMGIRLRHEIFDRWLSENRTVEYAIEHLPAAMFDPEFSSPYEKLIISDFNSKYGKSLTLKGKREVVLF